MNTEKNAIQVRLAGTDLQAAKVAARDVAKVIAAVERMIAAVIVREYPELDIDEARLKVGLAAVGQGSYRMEFVSSYEIQAIQAFRKIGSAITLHQVGGLPERSIEALTQIRKVSERYDAPTQFWLLNGSLSMLAQIDKNTPLETSDGSFEVSATLYGEVIRVGGEKPPRAKVRFLSGEYLNCNITSSEQLRVARTLGQHLYEVIGLVGRGRWGGAGNVLIDFTIEDVTPYRQKRLSKALASTREVISAYLDAVDDIDAFMDELRGEPDGEIEN